MVPASVLMVEQQLYSWGGTFLSVGLNYLLGPRYPKQSVVKTSGTLNSGVLEVTL